MTVLLFLLFSLQSYALVPFLGAGFEFGGDSLVQATYADGSTSDIRAGRGLLFQGGGLTALGAGFELQAAFGLKWTSVKPAKNGDVQWIRWPLEALAFYREENIRLGAGPILQIGNRLHGTGDAAALSLDFADALGFVVQGDYLFNGELNPGLGLRYTRIRYRPVKSSASVNGSSLGLAFTWFFREGN